MLLVLGFANKMGEVSVVYSFQDIYVGIANSQVLLAKILATAEYPPKIDIKQEAVTD
jgi:hypothetical protein